MGIARAQREAMRKAAERKKQNSRIKPSVAESNALPDEGNGPFSIGYRHYRHDICKIKSMPISSIRKVIEHHKGVGLCYTEKDIFNLPFDVKRVTVSDAYKHYISHLTPETELSEFDTGEHRGFFFIDRTNRILEMVALDYHPEYTKNVR